MKPSEVIYHIFTCLRAYEFDVINFVKCKMSISPLLFVAFDSDLA